jgi:hypothetical protein
MRPRVALQLQVAGTHHRMTLEAATGRRITAKADAQAGADAVRRAIRAGTFH